MTSSEPGEIVSSERQASDTLVRQGFDRRVVLPWNAQPGLPLVVGEAPGRLEAETGVPFHPEAEAGGLFTRLMQRVGVERERFAITNCVWQRPPGNELYDTNGYPLAYTHEAIDYWKPSLLQLIQEMRPTVIIGLGRTALEVLTGFSDIGTNRGYVHDARLDVAREQEGPGWQHEDFFDRHELNIPCVCTYHPAFLSRGMRQLSGVFIRDCLAALELSEKGWCRPTLLVTPAPSPEAFLAFSRIYNPAVHKLTYDIENPDSRGMDEDEILEGKKEISYEIDRMSFCYDEGVGGYSVPFVEPFITMAKGLLASDGPKRGHNCRLHDRPRLESHGFQINSREYDTMDLWRHLHRTLPAGVAYLAPFYLNMSPWKHEAHAHPEFYSAMDAIVQHHIAEGIERDARASGQWQTMERHVVDVIGPDGVATQMARNGLPIDQEAMAVFKLELEAKQAEREAELQGLVPEALKPVKQKKGLKRVPKELAGMVEREFEIEPEELAKGEVVISQKLGAGVIVRRWALLQPFNPASPVQVKALIRHWGHKPKTDRKSKAETSNDETLKGLVSRYLESPKESDQKAVASYRLIRECRAIGKVLGTYVKGWRPGADGLIHATPGVWGDMFRISWRRPNLAATVADKKELQIAAGFRKCIRVPDSHVIIEADWKGMESVLVGHFAGDRDFMRLARLGVHDFMGHHMLRLPISLDMPDDELRDRFKWFKATHPKPRDDAKHTIHGVSYGMTAFLMAELYEMTRTRAQYLINLLFDLFPKVKQWQQATMQQAHEQARLTNAWGYRMPFWSVFDWQQKRYDTYRKLWVRWRTRVGDFTKRELIVLERIDAKVQGGQLEDRAIASLCWSLGDEAKSALAFLPRDTGAAMLKDALLRLEDEYGLASGGFMRSCAHDAILAIATKANADQVAHALQSVMAAPQARLNGLVIDVEVAIGQSWDKAAMREWQMTKAEVA